MIMSPTSSGMKAFLGSSADCEAVQRVMSTSGIGPMEPRKARILVVDDDPDIREALRLTLKRLGHEVIVADGGRTGLERLDDSPDLILLDVRMPEMDGFSFLETLRRDPVRWQVPVIMVTGMDGVADRLKAVEAGANDFISKPFELPELRVRTDAQLRLKAATDALRRHRDELEQRVEERTRALTEALEREEEANRRLHQAHLDTIRRLSLAAEFKDRETAAHIERIGLISAVLGRALGLPEGDLEDLRLASSMHDIGKIGIPDRILRKRGTLTPEERAVMETHATIGARILHGSSSQVLRIGASIALTHHERWDGSGYPLGLVGEEVPLEGRICAVADVFDAMTTDRPYRKAMPNDVVLEAIKEQSGRSFDAAVVHALLASIEHVEEIQSEYRDEQEVGLTGSVEASPWGGSTIGGSFEDPEAEGPTR